MSRAISKRYIRAWHRAHAADNHWSAVLALVFGESGEMRRYDPPHIAAGTHPRICLEVRAARDRAVSRWAALATMRVYRQRRANRA